MTYATHGDGMAAKFTLVQDGAQNDEGEPIPAWGFEFDGIFITDPYTSECSRFEVRPSYYGLPEEEASQLHHRNMSLRVPK